MCHHHSKSYVLDLDFSKVYHIFKHSDDIVNDIVPSFFQFAEPVLFHCPSCRINGVTCSTLTSSPQQLVANKDTFFAHLVCRPGDLPLILMKLTQCVTETAVNNLSFYLHIDVFV